MTAKKDGSEVEFHLEKSPFFRVIHVDGAFGGLAPSGGFLHVAVYNERNPLPKKITHELGPDGALGAEIRNKREGRAGIFREIEADLVLSLPAAIALRDWLTTKITEFHEIAGGKH